MSSDHQANETNTSRRLLLSGAIIGVAAAAWGMLERPDSISSSADVLARVNGVAIDRETYKQSLLRLQRDSEELLDDTDGDWVLDRLIDEELLVQRGLEIGMARQDAEVRGALVRALIASTVSGAELAEPDEQTLRDWFDENSERFSIPNTIATSVWRSTDEDSAQQIATVLRRDSSPSLPDGVERVSSIPDSTLTLAKARDYLGPAIVTAVSKLNPGSVRVFEQQGRWLIVRVNEVSLDKSLDFSDVQAQVLAEYRRAHADDALRNYIAELRDRARIELANE